MSKLKGTQLTCDNCGDSRFEPKEFMFRFLNGWIFKRKHGDNHYCSVECYQKAQNKLEQKEK